MATWTECSDASPMVLQGGADPSLVHLALVMHLPAATPMLRGTRAAVRSWLDAVAEPRGSWDVVVTELVANAVMCSPSQGQVSVAMHLSSGGDVTGSISPRVVCSVTNDGVWDVSGMEPPVPLDLLIARSSRYDVVSPTGRGLRIVSALTSGGEVSVSDGRTTVIVWLDRNPDVWYADGLTSA